MKSTGIVRKVDELGRVVIPIELRRTLNIDVKDALEIFTSEDTIILRRYNPLCYICGDSEGLITFKNKRVCSHCIKELKEMK
ncbi:MAG: AbrB/MazE/SpoVT family DNA-binding domain-containing protein [Clostridiales bacterium]|nr:AbrB/MazE/SpoVT family DNA-binding domain-containing protein [Clostridiales bacterium]